MVLDAFLLNSQQYKVRIKGKLEPRSPLRLIMLANETRAFGSPSTTVAN